MTGRRSPRAQTVGIAFGVLAAIALVVSSGRPAHAAVGGTYTATGTDVTITANGRASFGYTVPSPADGCAGTIQAFDIPLSGDSPTFRVDNNGELGRVAGRPTRSESVTLIGAWDGFAQSAVVGVVTTEPASGSTCPPLRRVWRGLAGAQPVLGLNAFDNAQGPVTIVGRSAPSGTVTLGVGPLGDTLSSISVDVTDGACQYSGTTKSTDFPPTANDTPLKITQSSFFGAPSFGSVAGVTVPNGARGALVLDGKGSCPTIAATFAAIVSGGTLPAMPAGSASAPAPASTPAASAPTPTPAASSTPASSPASTPTPVATPSASPTATLPAVQDAKPADTGAARFLGTPVFSSGGQALAIFSGGPVSDLEARAGATGASGAWLQDQKGGYQLLVVGGPSFINAPFRASFASGIPTNTPVTLTR